MTLTGTVAAVVSVLCSETTKLAGAGPLIVRVAVDVLRPRTLVGFRLRPLTVGG